MLTRRHHEARGPIDAAAPALFDYLDHHDRLVGHMTTSSWMMAGGRMHVETDALQGRAVGSKIRLEGRVLGVSLFVEEVVDVRDVPSRKAWSTVGDVRLLVIGPYRMGFDITPAASGSELRVYIDYELPTHGFSAFLGRLLGPFYARWCTGRMHADAVRAFAHADRAGVAANTATRH